MYSACSLPGRRLVGNTCDCGGFCGLGFWPFCCGLPRRPPRCPEVSVLGAPFQVEVDCAHVAESSQLSERRVALNGAAEPSMNQTRSVSQVLHKKEAP